MKIKLISCLLLLQVYYSQAQHKLSVGIDITTQVTGLAPGIGARPTNTLLTGAGLGVLKSFQDGAIGLKSGLGYQLSVVAFRNIPYGVLEEGEIKIVGTKNQEEIRQFISLPIAVSYRVWRLNPFALQVFGGMQLSYLYRTKYKVTSNYNGETENVTHPNTLYPFLDLGLGFCYKPAGKVQLFLKPKFTYGFKELPYSDSKNWLGLNLELYYDFW